MAETRGARLCQGLKWPRAAGPFLAAVKLESVTVACSRSASSAIFAFTAASIFRLVFVIFRSVLSHSEQTSSNYATGPKIRGHFRQAARGPIGFN